MNAPDSTTHWSDFRRRVRRWTPTRKAALVDAIHDDILDKGEMLALHGIGEDEFASWVVKRFEVGPEALRTTRLQDYPEVRSTPDLLADLPLFGFDLVVCDPPWSFALRSAAGESKSAQAQYACMPLDAIKAMPVGHLVGANSWLFLWATAPMLPHALAVMEAWGFTYRTRLAWRKLTPAGKPRLGTGYVVRTLHEDILVGAIGSPTYMRALPSLFDGVAREHSRKPDEFFGLVEAFAPGARRLDMFSRETRPGWRSWGAEASKFDPAPAPEAAACATA